MSEKDTRYMMEALGKFYKKLLHANDSLENAKKANTLTDSLFQGKWLGLKSKMRQEYIQRLDGTTLRICIVNAKEDTGNKKRTGLLWMHGGGYSIGMPEQDFVYGDMFVEDDSCVMILPDYKKSTEAPYPAALDDCYLTLVWMIVNAERLGINPSQIFIGGESAGGGLCAALSLFARDEGEINIAFQMPLYPMLDDRHTSSSANNDAPVWNTRLNDINWGFYKGGKVADKYCAPAREEDYTNLPPAFTFVGTIEPFYQEVKTYMQNLYNAGTKVMYKEYEGCFHAFDMMAYNTAKARHARTLTKNTFKYAQKHFFNPQPETYEDGNFDYEHSAYVMSEFDKAADRTTKIEIKEIDDMLEGVDIGKFFDKE